VMSVNSCSQSLRQHLYSSALLSIPVFHSYRCRPERRRVDESKPDRLVALTWI
jgi:hypothetical protein